MKLQYIAWLNRIAVLVAASIAILSVGNAHAGKLLDVLPSLYGGDGITLADTGHNAHFTASSLDELNALSDGLSGALNFGALTSTVSGFTFDMELGIPVQTQASLGPLLAERAATIGANRLNVALTYTRVDYDRFEGDNLNNIRLNFPHQDTPSIVGLDSIDVKLDIDLSQDVFALFGTYGVLPRLDVGLVVPVIHSELKVHALGTINYVGTTEADGIHLWDPNGIPDSPRSSAEESSVGIGDVIVRAKYHFQRPDRDWAPETAFVFSVKTPSGDEDDLQGTGDTRIVPMFVANRTYFDWLTPHINVGFEFVPNHSDQNNVKLLTGFDARAHERVTLAADFLGRFEVDDDDGIGEELLDFAVGTKINVWKSTLLLANFIIPINRNESIRSDLIWSVGIEYSFGAGD